MKVTCEEMDINEDNLNKHLSDFTWNWVISFHVLADKIKRRFKNIACVNIKLFNRAGEWDFIYLDVPKSVLLQKCVTGTVDKCDQWARNFYFFLIYLFTG